jgi:Fe-Mn family superoxide dismutase
MMTRRQAIKTTAFATVAAATVPGAIAQGRIDGAGPPPFTLPPLPYALDALEPHIDAQTMEIHHGRHHKAYVDNLAKAIADFPDLAKKPIEDLVKGLDSIPEKIRTAVRNNGGGHYNHALFWQMMKKNGGGEPKRELARAIEKKYGNFSGFQEAFTKAALSQFGSGWAWLHLQGVSLEVSSTPNQDSPMMMDVILPIESAFSQRFGKVRGGKPVLLGLDVWEHAYYLKYQNKRADYIAAWWNVVNWDFVAERYAKLKG